MSEAEKSRNPSPSYQSETSCDLLLKDQMEELEQEIPTLSDDLLMIIFDNLTTDEREALSTTCRRFRELDFELGNKTFDVITVSWNDEFHSVFGYTETYHFARSHTLPINVTYHTLRLFRRAKCMQLDINLKKTCGQSDFELISRILGTVSYEKLSVFVEAAQDCDNDFIYKLIYGRNLATVRLFYYNSVPHDANHVRNCLMQLPQLNDFKLIFDKSGDSSKVFHRDEFILNDRMLLFIASLTKSAKIFGNGRYTPQGILNVFDVVRQSNLMTKCLMFPARKKTCDELLSMPNLPLVKDDSYTVHNFVDYETDTIIYFVSLNSKFYRVVMAKLDDQGNVIE